MLGNTIEEIAWHKAGIMKRGVPAFTSPQSTSALVVLKERAREKDVPLQVVEHNPKMDTIQLGLAGDFQKTNASLAASIAHAHLAVLGRPASPMPPLPRPFIEGLERVRWSGRCETRREKNITWHIDGGHTLDSIKVAGTWFAQQIQLQSPPQAQATRVLVFNQQTRDAEALARALHKTLADALGDDRPFTHAFFCTNTTFVDAGSRPDLVSINTDDKAVKNMVRAPLYYHCHAVPRFARSEEKKLLITRDSSGSPASTSASMEIDRPAYGSGSPADDRRGCGEGPGYRWPEWRSHGSGHREYSSRGWVLGGLGDAGAEVSIGEVGGL